LKATTLRRLSYIACGTAPVRKSPTIATPVLRVLNPPVCPPITAEWVPPNRPSNTWPYLSTRKLYAMSHHPLECTWKS
jgi:hypothetical protein